MRYTLCVETRHQKYDNLHIRNVIQNWSTFVKNIALGSGKDRLAWESPYTVALQRHRSCRCIQKQEC